MGAIKDFCTCKGCGSFMGDEKKMVVEKTKDKCEIYYICPICGTKNLIII